MLIRIASPTPFTWRAPPIGRLQRPPEGFPRTSRPANSGAAFARPTARPTACHTVAVRQSVPGPGARVRLRRDRHAARPIGRRGLPGPGRRKGQQRQYHRGHPSKCLKSPRPSSPVFQGVPGLASPLNRPYSVSQADVARRTHPKARAIPRNHVARLVTDGRHACVAAGAAEELLHCRVDLGVGVRARTHAKGRPARTAERDENTAPPPYD